MSENTDRPRIEPVAGEPNAGAAAYQAPISEIVDGLEADLNATDADQVAAFKRAGAEFFALAAKAGGGRSDIRTKISEAVKAPTKRDTVDKWPRPVPALLSLNGEAAGLYPGEVALLVGAGGVGKSYLALRLALALTAREDRTAIHTSRGRLKMGRTGRALLVSAEDGAAVNYSRIRALLPDGELGELHTLDASEMVGAQMVTVARVSQLDPAYGADARVTRTVVRGTEFFDALRDSLTALRKKGRGIDLVIFDPLSRLAPYEAETDNGAAAALLQTIQHFARDTGAAVMVLHHQNKGARKDKDGGATSARGSSAIVDGARTVLTLSSDGLAFAKVSHDPEPNQKNAVEIGDLFCAMDKDQPPSRAPQRKIDPRFDR